MVAGRSRELAISDADRASARALVERARQEAEAARGSENIPVYEPRVQPPQLRKGGRPRGEAVAIVPTTLQTPAPARAARAAAEPQEVNEKKHQAFLKLAPGRMNNFIHYFKANILPLAAQERYDYTDDEWKRMVESIYDMGHELKKAFELRGKRDVKNYFSF